VKAAKGHKRNDTDLRRIVISLDDETFGEVQAIANRTRGSFAAVARDLIEWGLLAEKSGSDET
jgi:hypothetical protein